MDLFKIHAPTSSLAARALTGALRALCCPGAAMAVASFDPASPSTSTFSFAAATRAAFTRAGGLTVLLAVLRTHGLACAPLAARGCALVGVLAATRSGRVHLASAMAAETAGATQAAPGSGAGRGWVALGAALGRAHLVRADVAEAAVRMLGEAMVEPRDGGDGPWARLYVACACARKGQAGGYLPWSEL